MSNTDGTTSLRDMIDSVSSDEMKALMIEFSKIYEQRPIKDNKGGMEIPHCFWVWYLLKKINPTVVIESGLWYGQSTWLIETTCPNATLLCIDVDLNIQKYVSKKASYTRIDFLQHDWKKILGDECKNTLAFIDDHQNNYLRLCHAYAHKIKYMIFEDNYPTEHGDVLSLKKVLSGNTRYVIDEGGARTYHTMPANYRNQVLAMCEYYECPPPYLDTNITRWNDTFDSHGCKPALFNTFIPEFEVYKKEQLSYTNIAVVKLNV